MRDIKRVVDTTRPDDARGIGFRKIVTALHAAARGWLIRNGLTRRQGGTIVWKTSPRLPHSEFEEERYAVVGQCRLYAVHMSDAFLKRQPRRTPRISWSLWLDRPDMPEVGSPAPSMEEAMARAEAAFRAATGALNN